MNTQTKVTIIQSKLVQAHQLLMCLENNWKIISMISENPGINVTKLFTTLKMEQSDVSKRLMDLKKHDLVSGERNGKIINYYITKTAIKVAEKINSYVSSSKMMK
jgi:DNA-binding MarR family transcriptional regulator